MSEAQCGKITVLCRKRRQARDKHRERADKEPKPFAKKNEVCIAIAKKKLNQAGHRSQRERTP